MRKPGDIAPDFTLPDLNASRHTLADLIRGDPALLAFFKSSCPTCQFTMPFLERAFSAGQISVYGISQDNAGTTVDFLKRYGLTFPTLLDGGIEGYVASNAYQLTHVPTLYLVEQDGRIAWASMGFVKAELEQLNRRFSARMFQPGDRLPDRKPG
ncbi:MAG TPA: TlpA disulfide reductase family protein [Bryobacteraceae bacterium]|nr:TlpA disulfide reductase family protein [Bryobacteraceae bacterium]